MSNDHLTRCHRKGYRGCRINYKFIFLKMKELNWVRILRITIGTALLGSYIFYSESVLVLLAGGMLLAQGILNVGCPPFIGANSCKGSQKPFEYQKEDNTVVDYEVIS